MLTCGGLEAADRSRDGGRADHGFAMMEALVAIAVVSVVMLSLTSFFVVSTRIDSEQGDRLAGIQAADDAMERARGLQAGAILTGRDFTSSAEQWTASAITAVQSLLNTTTMAYDSSAAAGSGATAALPTTYRSVVLNGTQFRQYWYVGTCQRATGAAADCLATALTSGYTPFYRMIVAVTWPGRSCASNLCSYVTSSLIGSDTDEPIFNTGTPALTAPNAQTNDMSVALSLTVAESGGATPLTWTASALPTGLTIDSSSGTISGTPTTAGTFAATVNVTDAYGVQDSVGFSWVINALPAMTAPGTVSSPGGVAFSKTFAVSNGTSPYGWVASGLPTGLSLNAGTGTVSGTPSAVGTGNVTLTVTDQFNQSSSQTFSWTVPALSVTGFTVPASRVGTTIASVTPAASGGISPYVSWSATNLPAGLSLNGSTGVISGKPTAAGTYPVVITVTDSAAGTASLPVSWVVS